MSEVVTNAILHGRPPVTVRLRGTRNHPRVEVRDKSPEPPAPTQSDVELEFQLEVATFGRGLAIVASSSLAWGAERDGDGKMVWFEPAVDAVVTPSPGIFEGFGDADDEPSFDDPHSIVVHLLNVPTELMQATLGHSAELRRELRLLAVAHQDTYPVASDLSTFFSALARDFRWQLGGDALMSALQKGEPSTDITVTAPVDAGHRFARLMELYDLADAFCRNERLLTLSRTPEQVEFQTWLFGEFVRQSSGAEPTPWSVSPFASSSRAHP